jgi:predicted nucleic-acid-binding Zn-ribbon protein
MDIILTIAGEFRSKVIDAKQEDVLATSCLSMTRTEVHKATQKERQQHK